MTFVPIEAGCFQMGSNEGPANETPEHTVCLESFWMGTHEINQYQWQKIMGILPEQARVGDTLPVENVSWNMVNHAIQTLNSNGSAQFRLPTEAEWEYACREGGKSQPFCGGSDVDLIAWHIGNSTNQIHPTGTLNANMLGLFDMSGNVWEWVADWYDPNYYKHAPTNNPKGPSNGVAKVFRGGAWLSEPKFLRTTLRYDLAPERGYHLLGFRLVAIPPEKEVRIED